MVNATAQAVRWLKQQAPVESAEGQTPFIPKPKIAEYFEKYLHAILLELQPDDRPTERTILNGQRGFIGVFATLLLLEQQDLIGEFVSKQLSDQRLPLYEIEKPTNFPVPVNDDGFFEKFRKAHWQFFAHSFEEEHDDVSIAAEIPLPFLEKEEIDAGGSARIYKIKIDKYYDHLDGQMHHGDREFILKVFFDAEAETCYTREVDAFKRIRDNRDNPPNVVSYYYSFRYQGQFSLILEVCNKGNLREYFEKERHPRNNQNRLVFWRKFLGIIDGVQAIHNIERDLPEGKQIVGWHQDLKLENILVHAPSQAEPFDHIFKITDFGLAHFKEGPNNSQIYGNDRQGTKTFGAPELYRSDGMGQTQLRATNSSDIWSLCCIITVTIGWTLFGLGELGRFAELRKEETERANMPPGSDCFHDGERVLDCVRKTLKEYLNECNAGDVITPKIIHLIDGLLIKIPKERSDAHSLAVKKTNMLKRAEEDMRHGWQETIRQSEAPVHVDRISGESSLAGPVRFQPPIPPLGPESRRHTMGPRIPPHTRQRSEGSGDTPSRESSSRRPVFSAPNTARRSFATVTPIRIEEQSSTVPSFNGNDNTVSNGNAMSPTAATIDTVITTMSNAREKLKLPSFDIAAAEKWYKERKNLDWWTRKREPAAPLHLLPSGLDLLGRLDKKDHVFIIDNNSAMQEHWTNVSNLLKILSYMVKRSDDNGLDLYFGSNPRPINNENTAKLVAACKSRMPGDGLTSNLIECLTVVLQKYQNVGFRADRRLNVYVLTNGEWSSAGQAGGIDGPIRNLIKFLDLRDLPGRPVAIQFIQFGNDSDCTVRLQYLDHLKKAAVPTTRDLVDHTPYDGGNIWKMLLGAQDDMYDSDDERE